MQQAGNYRSRVFPPPPHIFIVLPWNDGLHEKLSFEPVDFDELHASSEFVYATDLRTNEDGHRLSLVPTLSCLTVAAAFLHVVS